VTPRPSPDVYRESEHSHWLAPRRKNSQINLLHGETAAGAGAKNLALPPQPVLATDFSSRGRSVTLWLPFTLRGLAQTQRRSAGMTHNRRLSRAKITPRSGGVRILQIRGRLASSRIHENLANRPQNPRFSLFSEVKSRVFAEKPDFSLGEKFRVLSQA
jgi:hypothetical protein